MLLVGEVSEKREGLGTKRQKKLGRTVRSRVMGEESTVPPWTRWKGVLEKCAQNGKRKMGKLHMAVPSGELEQLSLASALHRSNAHFGAQLPPTKTLRDGSQGLRFSVPPHGLSFNLAQMGQIVMVMGWMH